MIPYPKLKASASYRQVLDRFKGYNRNLRIGSGEFSQMENLTSDDYPVLSVRKQRGFLSNVLQDGGTATGALYVPGAGLFITVDQQDPQSQDDPRVFGSLHLLGEDGENRMVVWDLMTGHKSLALMGKRLIIAPDMKWVDIDSLTTGSLEETWVVNQGKVDVCLCDKDGNVYQNVTTSAEPPANPGYHQLWLCTAVGSVGLNQYEPATSQWVSIASTYVKMTGLGDHRFSEGDSVEISGLTGLATALNGTAVIQYVGHGEIRIPGILTGIYMQGCSENPVTLERKVPSLDFLVECGNRLWGCKADTNEIYGCKLGDPFNWNCFQGLSTDSWVGNVGTPGEFTGGAVQNGYPVFYKENCKHKVWPSATGAHQITTTNCDGVGKGSQGSVAVWDGTVFYKSPFGVFADDGGGSVEIGQALGNVRYHNGMGAIHDRKYYLSVEDNTGKRVLFVYDIARKMWHRETGINGTLCSAGDSLIGAHGDIWDLTGNTGTPEPEVSWMAVTGDLGLELPEQKYITRLTLRLSLDPGATLEVYAQYDREQTWVKLGQVYGTDLRSFSLPVRPRRCDQLRLKLQGKGMCKIYSITKTLGKGSEL